MCIDSPLCHSHSGSKSPVRSTTLVVPFAVSWVQEVGQSTPAVLLQFRPPSLRKGVKHNVQGIGSLTVLATEHRSKVLTPGRLPHQ